SVGLAGDRDHASIDIRSECPVDVELGRTGSLAPVERRIVEKRKPHRALDLERAVAGEEHRGRVGVDALDCVAAMGGTVGEERKHSVLRVVADHAMSSGGAAGQGSLVDQGYDRGVEGYQRRGAAEVPAWFESAPARSLGSRPGVRPMTQLPHMLK